MQRYEKMISGMYLGEITRQLCVSMSAAGALNPHSSQVPGTLLATPWALTTSMVSDIVSDTSTDLSTCARVLMEGSGLDPAILTAIDRRVIQELCTLVGRRAARVAAVGVAAVLMQCGTDGLGVHVGFDGSVFKRFPRFQEWMAEALGELGCSPSLVMTEDGSGIGAALVAAVAISGGAVRAKA